MLLADGLCSHDNVRNSINIQVSHSHFHRFQAAVLEIRFHGKWQLLGYAPGGVGLRMLDMTLPVAVLLTIPITVGFPGTGTVADTLTVTFASALTDTLRTIRHLFTAVSNALTDARSVTLSGPFTPRHIFRITITGLGFAGGRSDGIAAAQAEVFTLTGRFRSPITSRVIRTCGIS
jgi:hypothetical protein